MLFPLMSEYAKVRVLGYGGISSATTPVINKLADDFTGVDSDGGTGRCRFDLRDPSRRTIFSFGSCVSSSTNLNGGVLSLVTADCTSSQLNVQTEGNSGTAFDSTGFNGLAFCLDGQTTGKVNLNQVVCQQMGKNVLMVGNINSDGVVNSGKGDFSCTRSSTGTYALTWRKKLFSKDPVALICSTPDTEGNVTCGRLESVNSSGCTVYIAGRTGTLVDRDFNILVYGNNREDVSGRDRAPLFCTRRKGRVELYRIETTSLTYGSEFGSLTVNGTGSFTITHATPFRQAPYVFISAETNRYCGTLTTNTTSTSEIRITSHSGGSLTNPARCDVLVVGFDDPSDY